MRWRQFCREKTRTLLRTRGCGTQRPSSGNACRRVLLGSGEGEFDFELLTV
jgi:hypothetical protein